MNYLKKTMLHILVQLKNVVGKGMTKLQAAQSAKKHHRFFSSVNTYKRLILTRKFKAAMSNDIAYLDPSTEVIQFADMERMAVYWLGSREVRIKLYG